MKKIQLTENEKKQIIGLYQSKNIILTDKNNNSINEAPRPRKLAKRFASMWGKKAYQNLVFTSRALKDIVNRESGYIYEPGSATSTYLEGDDFLNAIERNLERWGNIDVHRFLMANDPTYLRSYIFKVLLPRYMKDGDQQTLTLIENMLDTSLRRNEIMGSGEFPTEKSQFENLLAVINSDEFKNTETQSGRNRLLTNVMPYELVASRFGKFVDKMPAGQLRQTLRFIADWNKSAAEIKADIYRLIDKPHTTDVTSKMLIEKLNVLESKRDSAANALYKELIGFRSPIEDKALRESLKALVESKNTQEIWTLTSDSYTLKESLLDDAMAVTDSIFNMFKKGKRMDGLKKSASNLITYLVHGNMATFRSLNEKIIASNSVGKGFALWLARTLVSELIAPLFGTGFYTLYQFGKFVLEYFGIQTKDTWNDGDIINHMIEQFSFQFKRANQEGIAAYIPWFSGVLSYVFRCWFDGKGLKQCNVDKYAEDNPPVTADVVTYPDTEEGFKSYLEDNNFAYSEAKKIGDDYKVSNRRDSEHGSGQTYWFKHEVINGKGTFTSQ